MEETFESSIEVGAGYSVVTVTGEIDVATAPVMRDRLEEALTGGPAVVIVDLLGVTFIDSTALGVLIGARKQSVSAGGSMRLVIAEARILKVFEITGLTELFPIRATRDEAVAG